MVAKATAHPHVTSKMWAIENFQRDLEDDLRSESVEAPRKWIGIIVKSQINDEAATVGPNVDQRFNPE